LDTNEKKPKLDIPYTALERVVQVLPLIAIAWSIVYLIVQWPELPSRIPAHFNGKGEIDRWGSKWELIILPAIGIVLYAGLAVLSRFPHVYNYPVRITEENAPRQYALARKMIGWLNLEIVAIFLYIQRMSILSALEDGDGGLGQWSMPIILAVLLGTIVGYFVLASRAK